MEDPTKPVRRCICANITFEQMKQTGLNLSGLKRVYGITQGCGTCLPYVKKMLETGETQFAVLPLVKD